MVTLIISLKSNQSDVRGGGAKTIMQDKAETNAVHIIFS